MIRTARGRVGRGALRREESGGAMSMWVLLMVPVAALAATMAMAGPQRLAAEVSMEDMAQDLAALVVAQRVTEQHPKGPLPVFPPTCSGALAIHTESLDDQVSVLTEQIDSGNLVPNQLVKRKNTRDLLRMEQEISHEHHDRFNDWEQLCQMMSEFLADDLTRSGFEASSLRVSYTDALSSGQSSSDPGDGSQPVGDGSQPVLCRLSPRVEVRDAVFLVLAADWNHAGWAAAQTWPGGISIGVESSASATQAVAASSAPDCKTLGLHDDSKLRSLAQKVNSTFVGR